MPRLRTHPGEVLREEYLVPFGLSACRRAPWLLGVPANRLTEIMRDTRDVSADTAIRLGRYFGTDPRFWLNLQAAHDCPRRRGCTAIRTSCRARRRDRFATLPGRSAAP